MYGVNVSVFQHTLSVLYPELSSEEIQDIPLTKGQGGPPIVPMSILTGKPIWKETSKKTLT